VRRWPLRVLRCDEHKRSGWAPDAAPATHAQTKSNNLAWLRKKVAVAKGASRAYSKAVDTRRRAVFLLTHTRAPTTGLLDEPEPSPTQPGRRPVHVLLADA
jgi:hypothetical protein